MGTVKYRNATYEGETTYYNGESVPHGKGILKYTNGIIYEGSFRYGKYDGFGKLSFDRNPDDGINHINLEIGEFKNDHLVKGTMYYENGASIEGNFENDIPVGEAKFTYSSGNYVYAPIIIEKTKIGRDNRPKLWGKKITIYFKDGSIRFQGWCDKNNQFDFGDLYYENGDHYNGSFKNNNFHGWGTYAFCISKSRNIYIEENGYFKEDSLYKHGSITVDDETYYYAKKLKNDNEIYYLTSLKTIERFVNYDVNKNTFTHDRALYEKVAKRVLKDYPYYLSLIIKYINALFTYFDFEARFHYKDGEIIDNPKVTFKDDLIWNFILKKGLVYLFKQCLDGFGSRKEFMRILDEIKKQEDFQKEFIPFTLGNGERHDGKVHVSNKIKPQEDKPFVYNYDRNKRRPTKKLVIKFVLREFGYRIIGSQFSFINHQLVLPEYYDNKKIKSVKERAFVAHSDIHVLDIPGNIKIGRHAFYNCKNLETIIISGDFQKIDPTAIERVVNLKHIIYFDTKEHWRLYHAKQQWLKYLDSKYIVTIHCKDGNLTL